MFFTKTKSQFFSDFIPNVNEEDKLLNWVYLDNTEQTHSVLSQTRITEKAATTCEGAMEIVYKNKQAFKYRLIEEGEYDEFEDLMKNNLEYRQYPINTYKRINFTSEGSHQIGGTSPKELTYPKSLRDLPFLYLGFLNGQTELIKWIEIETFHILFPVFSDIDLIYLDYSDPNNIKLYDKNISNNVDSISGEITKDSFVIYESRRFNFVDPNLDQLGFNNYGNCGSPHWLQNQIIPTCPISNKNMKFLLQLKFESDIRIPIRDTNIQDTSYCEFLGFDFNIYIFIEPKTKMVALYQQMT
jgi:hypothetical protein